MQQLELYRMILDYLLEGAYIVDPQRTIIAWNPSAEKITGYSAAETVGKNCADNILRHIDEKGTSLCTGLCPVAKSMLDLQTRDAVVYLHHKQGHRVPVSIRVIPLLTSPGQIAGAMEVFLPQKESGTQDRLKELARTAFHDQITSLFNRTYLESKLRSVVSTAAFQSSSSGLLAFDLVNLKEINEENGPQAGDAALQVCARTLSANLSPGDVAGRWFGGRFLVITNTDNKSFLLNWSHKLKALIEQSDVPGYDDIRLKATVGGIALRAEESLEWIESRLEEQMRLSRAGSTGSVSIQSDKP